MPDINTGDSSPQSGQTFAVGFWDSEICYNNLAIFPDGVDPSWGNISLYLDGCDSNNYVELKILSTTNDILYSKKYITNGRKAIDVSQIYAISSNQDIKVRIEITTYV